MKIGFLLHKSPEHQDSQTVKRLTAAFIDAGHEVSIFLMEDGVLNAIINNTPRRLTAGFDELVAKGAKISLCTFTTEIRGLRRDQFLEGINFHSQYDLSIMVNECDRFLSFV